MFSCVGTLISLAGQFKAANIKLCLPEANPTKTILNKFTHCFYKLDSYIAVRKKTPQ